MPDVGPAPTGLGGIVRIAPKKVKEAGGISHFDVGLLGVEKVSQSSVSLDRTLHKGSVAEVTLLVAAELHAPGRSCPTQSTRGRDDARKT